MSGQLPKGFFKQQGINLYVGIHSHLMTSVKLPNYMTSIKEHWMPLFIIQFLLHFQNGVLGKNKSLRNSEAYSLPWNWKVPPSIKNQLQKFKFKRKEPVSSHREQCRREFSIKIRGRNSSEHNRFTSKELCVLIKSQVRPSFARCQSLMVGLDDLKGLFQPKRFYDSINYPTETHFENQQRQIQTPTSNMD